MFIFSQKYCWKNSITELTPIVIHSLANEENDFMFIDSARHVLQVLCMMTFETLPWIVRHGTRIKSKSCKGSFFNYVDQNLPIIDPLPIYLLLTLVKEILYCHEGKSAYRCHFQYHLNTYLPRLVNVVKERPTKESKDFAWTELRTEVVRMLGLFASYPRVWGDHLKESSMLFVCCFWLKKKISCAWFALHDYFYPIVKLLKNNQ